MQKIATKVFVYASLSFAVLGTVMILLGADPGEQNTGFVMVISKLFMINVFVILSSFALSVAGKYLNNK